MLVVIFYDKQKWVEIVKIQGIVRGGEFENLYRAKISIFFLFFLSFPEWVRLKEFLFSFALVKGASRVPDAVHLARVYIYLRKKEKWAKPIIATLRSPGLKIQSAWEVC